MVAFVSPAPVVIPRTVEVAMLKQHSDRVATYFAADFQPQVSFVRKLPEVAEKLAGSLRWKDWSIAPNRILLIERAKGILFHMDHRRLAWQTLGLDKWRDGLNDFVSATLDALRIFQVTELNRIGFKVHAFLPLELSQLELTDLCFDSFYVAANELSDIIGKPYDCAVRLFGEKSNQKFELQLLPMNIAQASESFRVSFPNIDKLVENPLADNVVRDFHSKISQADCLGFEFDAFQEGRLSADICGFVADALKLAEESCDACIARMKSLPGK